MKTGSTQSCGWFTNSLDGADANTTPLKVYMCQSSSCYAFYTNGRIYINSTVCSSDRNLKTDFQAISVLPALRQMPVTKWRFCDSQDFQIGPVAQDFNCAFKLSHDWQTNLTVSGLDGIALRGVQELDECITSLQCKIQKLECEMAALREMIN